MSVNCQQTTVGSFLICDPNSYGLPIGYVSPGFTELSGHSRSECLKKPWADIVGTCSILADDEGLANIAAVACLTLDDLCARLKFLMEHACTELARMKHESGSATLHVCARSSHAQNSGCLLVVSRRKSGEFFVCEVAAQVLRHPGTKWPYIVTLHEDVSKEVSMADLLGTAKRGICYSELLARRRVSMQARLALFEHMDLVHHFHLKAEEMWGTSIAEGKKGSVVQEMSSIGFAKSKSISSRSTASLSSHGTISSCGSFASRPCFGIQNAPIAVGTSSVVDTGNSQETLVTCLSKGWLEAEAGTDTGCVLRSTTVSESLMPLLLANPRLPGCPVALCSVGFTTLTGYTEGDVLGKTRFLPFVKEVTEGSVRIDEETRSTCQTFLSMALGGIYYVEQKASTSEALHTSEGELVFAQMQVEKSGTLLKTLLCLRQVELDDQMMILAVQVPVHLHEGVEELENLQEFRRLRNCVRSAEQLLAANFWVCGPMRRQQVGEEDEEENGMWSRQGLPVGDAFALPAHDWPLEGSEILRADAASVDETKDQSLAASALLLQNMAPPTAAVATLALVLLWLRASR